MKYRQDNIIKTLSQEVTSIEVTQKERGSLPAPVDCVFHF